MSSPPLKKTTSPTTALNVKKGSSGEQAKKESSGPRAKQGGNGGIKSLFPSHPPISKGNGAQLPGQPKEKIGAKSSVVTAVMGSKGLARSVNTQASLANATAPPSVSSSSGLPPEKPASSMATLALATVLKPPTTSASLIAPATAQQV